MMNRTNEIHRNLTTGRISSTGLGVGETFEDVRQNKEYVIRISDLNKLELIKKLEATYEAKREEVKKLHPEAQKFFNENTENIDITSYRNILMFNVYNEIRHAIEDRFDLVLSRVLDHETVILEGSQGTLLDMDCGEKPYITKSKVTLSEAERLIGDRINSSTNLGITRGYITRHGIGPLPSEDKLLSIPDTNNVFNEWQREFRVGWLDLNLLKKSVDFNPKLSGIVVTNLDRLPEKSFYLKDSLVEISPKDISSTIENHVGKKVMYESWGEELNFKQI